MFFDKNYDYKIISNNEFDYKILSSNEDGSKYKKYLLIYYLDNNIIKYEELPDESYLNKFNNILSRYNVEEIISSCDMFDSMFNYKKYYRINNKFCFIKYNIDKDDAFLVKDKDTDSFEDVFNKLIHNKLKETL